MAPLTMPKPQLLCTPVPNQISILGEVEKSSLIALPGKGGHTGLLPQEAMCLHSKELEGFTTVSQLLIGVSDKTSV